MKIEDQVCTMEQAEKLLGLGVRYNNPQFAFVLRLEEMRLCNVLEYNRWAAQYNEPFVKETTNYPAFTVAELGVMLGKSFQVDLSTFPPTRGKYYIYGTTNDFDYYDTEAQARAAKLIDVIERDFITVEEVNQRLNK